MPNIEATITVLTLLIGVLGALAKVLAELRGLKIKVNGRLEELLIVSKEVSRLTGILDGMETERQRIRTERVQRSADVVHDVATAMKAAAMVSNPPAVPSPADVPPTLPSTLPSTPPPPTERA